MHKNIFSNLRLVSTLISNNSTPSILAYSSESNDDRFDAKTLYDTLSIEKPYPAHIS